MFGRPKPVVLDRYGSRRSRPRVPGWLLLLLAGATAGALGVLYVQDAHLPPRLSAAETASLTQSYQQADAERQRLQRELATTGEQLKTALADKEALTRELGGSRETVQRLREDLASLVASLPPDPRGGEVAVRAARFEVEGGALAYDVVLSREGRRTFNGVMQLVVAGAVGNGPETSVRLEPVSVSFSRFESVRGTAPLPEGFRPRQTSVQVLDRPGGRLSGMRVMYVRDGGP